METKDSSILNTDPVIGYMASGHRLARRHIKTGTPITMTVGNSSYYLQETPEGFNITVSQAAHVGLSNEPRDIEGKLERIASHDDLLHAEAMQIDIALDGLATQKKAVEDFNPGSKDAAAIEARRMMEAKVTEREAELVGAVDRRKVIDETLQDNAELVKAHKKRLKELAGKPVEPVVHQFEV